jgi:hypothetical protein
VNKVRPKGPWIHRFAIRFFSILFGFLVYWLLGFIVEDIDDVDGPDYQALEKEHVDASLYEQRDELEIRRADVEREIKQKQRKQKLLGDSSQSLQKTMGQLLELQKLSLEKALKLSETEQQTFADSMNLFLENQRRYQAMNEEMTGLMDQQTALESERSSLEKEIQEAMKPAREAYNDLLRKHNLRLASYQLCVLIPVLLLAAFFIVRKKGSIYFPIHLAFGAAALIKVSMVIHDYFPSQAFKYILIVVFLVAVLKLTVYFIRAIAFPKTESLVKQYREAYERFLCPVCEHPIRRGPLKFRYWNRRTIKKLRPSGDPGDAGDHPYTCPACSTRLYDTCPACTKVRHSMLPCCEHCGDEQPLSIAGQ